MTEATSDIAKIRAARLKRGINLSHWYSQVYSGPGYVPAHFDTYLSDRDFRLICEIGFDHVRLPIGCEPIMHNPDTADAYINRLVRTIRTIQQFGLAVIVDIHPETEFKERLATSNEAVHEFVRFWRQFAKSLAHTDPEKTYLELLNEPCLNVQGRWEALQIALVKAVRIETYEHTIIIAGDSWSQLPELVNITPPEDDNLIANFHFYDPSSFTHQGAGWLPPWAQYVKGLRYPADRENIQSILRSVKDEKAREHLLEYENKGWNAEVYRDFLEPALAWAQRYNIPLMCNEFGVYKRFSDRASRLNWLGDVTGLMESLKISWTMWDYAGDFAVVKTVDGHRVPDDELVSRIMHKTLESAGSDG